MKQDILNQYRLFLYTKFSKNTADKYYFSLKTMVREIQFDDAGDISRVFFETEISKIKNKNDFSAAKNALLNLKELYPHTRIPTEEFFKSKSLKKRNWSKKPRNIIYLDTVKRKVNAIKNEKIKYAFRLAMVSGLRVSELAGLTKADVEIQDEKIIVNVRNGKGGSNGAVECMPDTYLSEVLMEYMADKEPDEELFYSASYMKQKAADLGIQCHDLRRITAINFRKSIINDVGKNEANEKTQKMLRHKRFSTTKRYLYNKKLIIKENRGE